MSPVPRVAAVMARIAVRALGVVLLGVALVQLVAPRATVHPQPRWLVALVTAAVLALAARHRPSGRSGVDRPASVHRIVMRESLVRRLAVRQGAIGGGLAAVLGTGLAYDATWDPRLVAWISRDVVERGGPQPWGVEYLSHYPANLPILGVENLARRLAGVLGVDAPIPLVLVNAVAVGLACGALYVAGARVGGHRCGMVGSWLAIGFVAVSPWNAVFYTDLLPMAFVAVGLALAVCAVLGPDGSGAVAGEGSAPGWRGVAWRAWLGAALVFGMGAALKPPVVVPVVALVLVALGLAIRRSGRRVAYLLVAVGVAVTSLAGMRGAELAWRAATGVSVDAGLQRPVEHFAAMGLGRIERNGQGAYGIYDVAYVERADTLDRVALQQFARDRITQRLSELGPVGYVRFAAAKTAFNLGDGMLWAWGEGKDDEAPRLTQWPTSTLAVWLNHPSSPVYAVRVALTQGAWLALLIWVGWRCQRARPTAVVTMMALTVIGIAVFMLLFEGRSRYLIAEVPALFALAAALVAADGWGPPAATSRFRVWRE